MATVCKPPTPLPISYPGKILFLAGSIEMNRAENWQQRLTSMLDELDILILNPRRESWDSSWVQRITNPHFKEQVNWELDGLNQSDLIVVYFDPNTQSPITLMEVGLYAASEKMIICCPDGFWRKGNIEVICDRYNIPLVENLEQLLFLITARFQPI